MSTCSYSSSNGILDYIDENRLFSFITTSTFVIIGVFVFIVSLYRYFEKENIPRIAQPFIPYGNIKDVIDKDLTLFELISKYYYKLKKKGLKYGGMYLFFKPGIVIVDTALVNEILLNKKVFSDGNVDELNFKTTLEVLLSPEIIEEYLKHSSNNIREQFVKSLKENNKVQDLSHDFVVDSMSTIFGLDRNGSISKLIATLEQSMTASSLKNIFCLAYPSFKLCKHQELYAVIENTKLKRKKNDIKKKDILQRIIENENVQTSELLSQAYLNNFIKNIVYSYYSSLFCLYELSKNVDIQEELIGEVRRFISGDKTINDLPYLEAVVKETLRVYPPVPLIVKRCQEYYESTELGLKLAKNNLVLIPTSAIHHDASIYVDPENFDPDRFLEDDIEKLSIFLPFGSKHIGHEERHKEFQNSIIVMKVLLVSIFSNFKVKLNKNYYLNFDSTKLNMQPEKCLPLELEPLP